MKHRVIQTFACFSFLVIVSHSLEARTSQEYEKYRSGGSALDEEWPYFCMARHNIGEIKISVDNRGMFGSVSSVSYMCHEGEYEPLQRVFTTREAYLAYGAVWIGGVVGNDTLVSTGRGGWTPAGYELNPDIFPFGFIEHRSIIDPRNPEYEGAKSEQDYLAHYTDTLTGFLPDSYLYQATYDSADGRQHLPLGIEVFQRSYAWSYEYAEDFVLFDYTIKSIADQTLWDVYVGLYVDGDVYWVYRADDHSSSGSYQDEITGFLPTYLTEYGGCQWQDTINLAWFADNDADYQLIDDTIIPLPDVAGVRLIRTPSDELRISYNWWVSNNDPGLSYGPQTRKAYRYLGKYGGGQPLGDRNKYHYLSNGEFDFDQIFTRNIRSFDSDWVLPGPGLSGDISDGLDSRYLLSFGPFTVSPGQSLPVSFAYVRGDDFHRHPSNAPNNLIDGYHPGSFMDNVYFDDIVRNSTWAGWVYDNPGVDTDGDGYFGKYRLCCADSSVLYIDSSNYPRDTTWGYGDCTEVFYEGDGVPDFRGALPPTQPEVWLEPRVGEIRVRFNGTYSETSPDVFTRCIDFEGYRVHMALDERATSYTLMASYDRENFDKLVWDTTLEVWEIIDTPFTAKALACLYADSCQVNFNPLKYVRNRPYIMPDFPDSIFYFRSHENNLSELGRATPIRKVYPYEPYPSTLIIEDALPTELTENGLFKYFEYEYLIKDILPTVQYYVAVTVFDFGSPKSGLDALETSKTLEARRVYALPSATNVRQEGLEVYCYPNPYLINEDYLGKGLEGRDLRNLDYYLPERSRRLHFANLPAKCIISIFSLDGDLIKQIDHDYDIEQADASHETWDLLSRATMPVVTGIYYWVVEAPGLPDQIGKFVIIK